LALKEAKRPLIPVQTNITQALLSPACALKIHLSFQTVIFSITALLSLPFTYENDLGGAGKSAVLFLLIIESRGCGQQPFKQKAG
jgi:hypothetical protein